MESSNLACLTLVNKLTAIDHFLEKAKAALEEDQTDKGRLLTQCALTIIADIKSDPKELTELQNKHKDFSKVLRHIGKQIQQLRPEAFKTFQDLLKKQTNLSEPRESAIEELLDLGVDVLALGQESLDSSERARDARVTDLINDVDESMERTLTLRDKLKKIKEITPEERESSIDTLSAELLEITDQLLEKSQQFSKNFKPRSKL